MRTSTSLAPRTRASRWGRAGGALVCLAAVLALADVAHATITEALSLAELVARADRVLVVSCEGAQARRDGAQRIVTDHTLRVEEVLRGPGAPGDLAVMRTLGGAIGDLGMRVEGEPHLAVGSRYLVFLRRLSDGTTLRPVGMSQGVMPIDTQADGTDIVQPGGAGLALRQRVSGGRLVDAPPALLHPEPLDAVRERVSTVTP